MTTSQCCSFSPSAVPSPNARRPTTTLSLTCELPNYQETAGLVDHFVAIGRKRIAVFYQIDAYGRNGWEGVRSALAKHGLKISGEATYRRGTAYSASLKPQVDILRRSGAEAVVCIGSYAACAAFVRDARDAGWDV